MQISFHSTKYNYQWSVKQDDIFPPYFSQIHQTSHHLVTNSNFCSVNFPSSALADPKEVVCEGSWATSHKICRFKSCLIWHNNSCNDRIPSYYSTGWFLFPWYCRQQLYAATSYCILRCKTHPCPLLQTRSIDQCSHIKHVMKEVDLMRCGM